MFLPHLWQLAVTPEMVLVMAFVPVAETITRLYFRTYRRFGRQQLLRPLVDIGINVFNRKVVAQKRRGILSQPPHSRVGVQCEGLFPAISQKKAGIQNVF